MLEVQQFLQDQMAFVLLQGSSASFLSSLLAQVCFSCALNWPASFWKRVWCLCLFDVTGNWECPGSVVSTAMLAY